MADAVVRYKLDFVVKLIDTTTGRPVSERQVLFRIDGQAAVLSERMEGMYICFNRNSDAISTKDMTLEVNVKGYRAAKINVSCSILSEQYPTIEIPLIPEHTKYGYSNVVTLEGIMNGIEAIEAVSLHAPLAKIVTYNRNKQTIKLLYAGIFEEKCYALLKEQQNVYETFRIADRKNGLSLKLQNPLETDCHTGETITRIVKGCVDKNGRYLLCVREDAFGTEYLVKYAVKGNVYFKKIIFDNPKERRLD